MKVRFWGVRGSIPTPWKEAMQVGGNTSCVQIIPSEEHLIIMDAGTGIRLLGSQLLEQYPQKQITGHIFLSHTHWDHIQGFPFFAPAFVNGNHFYIYGAKKADEQLEDILRGQMRYNYFPIELEQMGAKIDFVELLSEEEMVIEDNIKVRTQAFNHPGGVFGFRVEYGGYAVVYATDMEYTLESLSPKLIEFAQGADLLIHDAQYTLEEHQQKSGWGHSNPQVAAHVAKTAGVKRLILFHHDPSHSDEFLAEIEKETRQLFAETYLATEGLEIDLRQLT